MKNSKNIILVFLSLVIVSSFQSCKKKYEAPNDGPTQLLIKATPLGADNITGVVNINDIVSFGDLSQGVVNRLWTLPDGVAQIVGEPNSLTTTKNIFKAKFVKSGMHKINVSLDFRDSVFVVNKKFQQKIDTFLTIDVFDSVKTTFVLQQLDKDGNVVKDLSTSSTNEIQAGTKVKFTATTTGRATKWDWQVGSGEFVDPDTKFSTAVIINFPEVGLIDFSLISSRERPFGADSIMVESLFKVIPSVEPVDLLSIEDTSDEKLKLTFSRLMRTPSNLNDNFEVSIKNGSVELTPSVTAVIIDENDPKVIYLEIDDMIYNTDVIKVSYTGGLFTSDGVEALPFQDQSVAMNVVNVIKNAEGEEATDALGFEIDANWSDASSWSMSMDLARPVFSESQALLGRRSLYVKSDSPTQIGAMNLVALPKISLETNSRYMIQYSTYQVGGTDVGSVDLFPIQDWAWSASVNGSDMKMNEWTTHKIEYMGGKQASVAGIWLRVKGPMEVYIDDIKFFKIEERP